MTVADAALFARTLTEREERATYLRAEIEALKVEEEDEVRKSIRTDPRVRTLGVLDSPASRARRRREKLEKELRGIEQELPHLRSAALEAGHADVERQLEELAAELRAVESRAPKVWKQMGALYQELLSLYVREAGEIARERRRIDLEAKEATNSYGQLRTLWETVLFPTAQLDPLPSTFESAVQKLRSEAAEDPEVAAVVRERPEAFTGMGYVPSVRVEE